MRMKNKFKYKEIVEVVKTSRVASLGFWVGIIGLFLATTKIEIGVDDTWMTLIYSIKDFLMHPAKVLGALGALYGIFNNPTEKGVRDSYSVVTKLDTVELNKRLDLEAKEIAAKRAEKE